MRRQAGFSMIKLLFWLGMLAAIAWSTYLILPVYTTYWKVQDALSSISEGMIGGWRMDGAGGAVFCPGR